VVATARLAGLGRELSSALAPWRPARAVHDPGKVLLDVATAVALGGDCLADVAAVRAQPAVFGPVASDPTVSRVVAALAADIDVSLPAIRAARATARAAVWARSRPLAGTPGRRRGGQVIIDIDATLVTAHSDKELATPTHKRGFGFSPMCAFVDHGEHGTGETLVAALRPGKASPWAVDDHLEVLEQALAQLPEPERAQVLVRTDTGGCSKAFLRHITEAGLEYSIGVRRPTTRTGTGQDWPPGMRVIARRERPHPGAQLRLTDHNGWRITCFATNTPPAARWRLADLEVRHRQRARAEDRIRGLKDTGLRNLPFHGYDQNRIWLEIVALAADLLAWTQILAFDEHEPARRWEPKKLRFRILAVAGRIIRTGRRRRLRLPREWPWNHLIDNGWAALQPT